nr:putative ribonuclease H-like domain-containing protein [Tanacetum cinerariifolium]
MPASPVYDRYKLGEGYHVVPPPYTGTCMPPLCPVYDRYKLGEGYHVVPPPYTGTCMPPKPDLVFHDAPTVNETIPTAFNVEPSTTKPNKDLHVVPIAVLTRSRLVLILATRPVNTDAPQTKVQPQRPPTHGVNNAHSPIRRPINLRPSPQASNLHQKVTTAKAPQVNAIKGVKGNWGNLHHALKDKGVIDSGCSRHMTGNISYLTDFEEINGGYVAFGRNLKGGKIIGNLPNPSDGIQEHFDADKAGDEPESAVHVSPSNSAKAKKHDDKTKREAKGKIPAVGKISTNSTNTFSAAGPSNTVVSPTLGKSSYVDPSQYPDDLNMPDLEDIAYFDDEEDVDHLVTQIIGDLSSAPQTRSITRMVKEQEPKRVHQALKDPSWIEAMQEELLQFKMQKMDVKSTFLYETIKEEVYVCQPLRFKDPDYHDKVYKVVKALYGLHQAPRAWYETLANYLLENGFQRGKIDQTLFIKKQKGDILLVQDKYVAEILRKFGLTDGKSASTSIHNEKPLLKDLDA